MAPHDTATPDFFESLYRDRDDPWNFARSEYEQGRFNTILQLLSHRRYRHTFEPGCSIGTLTEKLATISDRVTAADFSETAVSRAKVRCSHLTNVTFHVAALSGETAVVGYDLILLSEIGYYFTPEAWQDLIRSMASQLEEGTTVLASHWLGRSEDHNQSADEVHAALRNEPRLQLQAEERFPGFRINRFLCQAALTA